MLGPSTFRYLSNQVPRSSKKGRKGGKRVYKGVKRGCLIVLLIRIILICQNLAREIQKLSWNWIQNFVSSELKHFRMIQIWLKNLRCKRNRNKHSCSFFHSQDFPPPMTLKVPPYLFLSPLIIPTTQGHAKVNSFFFDRRTNQPIDRQPTWRHILAA